MQKLLLLFFLLLSANMFAQSAKLDHIFLQADSVVLIEHSDREGIEIVDSIGNNITPSFFVKGKLNDSIVLQRKNLSKPLVMQLLKVLKMQNPKNIGSLGQCFIPHHSISIYKNNKISFVDICFGCHNYKVSNNLKPFIFMDFDKKWEKLEAFFKKNGFIIKDLWP